MNDLTKKVLVIVLALLLGGFVGFLVGNNQPEEPAGASGSRYPNGVSADTTSPVAGEVRGTTFTSTGAATFASASVTGTLGVTGATDVGIFTSGGGCTASTTAVAAETWSEAFLLSSNCFTYSDSGVVAPAITITLPATSTMTTLLPNAGDTRTWLYDPAAYAAATTTTFAAGTGGILLEVGDGDATNVVIAGATSKAFITGFRLASTDVAWVVAEVSDAD